MFISPAQPVRDVRHYFDSRAAAPIEIREVSRALTPPAVLFARWFTSPREMFRDPRGCRSPRRFVRYVSAALIR